MSFSKFNLEPTIIKSIQACGYTEPTPIQEKSIPVIMEGNDIVASAQTGTGKTAAFVIPSLHLLSQQPHSTHTQMLVLTPTRELAKQVNDAILKYGKFLRASVVNLVGGMPYHQQIRELKRGASIIVATPGRLLDHIEQKRVDLSHLKVLILDEADRMLDMGFIEDVEMIAKLTPKNRQTLLFSATVDKQLTKVVQHLLKNPVRVDVTAERITVPKIKQELYRLNHTRQKSDLLRQLIDSENIFKAIIFSATKVYADKLADELSDEGYHAAALHGDLRQNVRNRTIEQFRRGKIQFLVATDVAARGLDISDVTHVINYDLPRFCEDYVHRIGRTGRAGKSGTAISFVMPAEMKHLQRIEKYIGQRLTFAKQPSLKTESAPKRHEPVDYSDLLESLTDDNTPTREKHRNSRAEMSIGNKPNKNKRSSDHYPSRQDTKTKRRFGNDEGRRSTWAEEDKPTRRSSKPNQRFNKDEGRRSRWTQDDKPGAKSSKPGQRFNKDEGRRSNWIQDDKPARKSSKPGQRFNKDEGRRSKWTQDDRQTSDGKPGRKPTRSTYRLSTDEGAPKSRHRHKQKSSSHHSSQEPSKRGKRGFKTRHK